MLRLAGTLLLALGVLMGALVALAPFGIGPAPRGLTPIALFTALTIGGYVLVAVASRTSELPSIARITGSLLILLAVAAAAGLVAVAGSFVSAPPGGLLSLWYVLLLGAAVGTASLLADRPVDAR